MDERIAGWIGLLGIALAAVVAFLARRSVRAALEGGDPTFYAPLIDGVMRIGVGVFLVLAFAYIIVVSFKNAAQ